MSLKKRSDSSVSAAEEKKNKTNAQINNIKQTYDTQRKNNIQFKLQSIKPV